MAEVAQDNLQEQHHLPFEEQKKTADNTRNFCIRWVPTSDAKLNKAEDRLLKAAHVAIKKGHVKLESEDLIWTVVANMNKTDNIPLVMVHGLGGGTGLWVLNLDGLSKNRALYAFDLLGFGQSSRPRFSKKPERAEEKFVQSIEDWRAALGIDRMVLLGHSFGGYLSSAYALKYPNRVKSLILVDPWGFERYSERYEQAPAWIRCILTILTCCGCNPLFAVRGAGPYGPRLVRKSRADFRERYEVVTANDKHAVHNYIYHCNAANPSGEEGFKSLTEQTVFPANPMLDRIDKLDRGIPLTFIYGAESWVGEEAGHEAKKMMDSHHVRVFSLEGAAHHVYADQPEQFHRIVNDLCDECDISSS